MSRNTRLRPLQPVFDAEKRLGSIQVGNTPPASSIYPFCDFFDRADGPLTAPWQPIGTMPEIVSNQLRAENGDGPAAALLDVITNVRITFGFILDSATTFTSVDMFARASPTFTSFLTATVRGDGDISLTEFVSLAPVQSDTGTWIWDNNPHDFELEVSGSSAALLIDSTPVLSLTGLSLSGGALALAMSSESGTTCIVDNFCAVPP